MIISSKQKRRHERKISYAESHQRELSRLNEMLGLPTQLRMGVSTSDGPHLMPQQNQKQMLPTPIRRCQDSALNCNTRRKENPRARFQFRVRPPYWFINTCRAWELFAYNGNSSWMFTIRAYNVIPPKSPVMEYVEHGNVEGIQKLFMDRQASPFDRDPHDFTLLDVGSPGKSYVVHFHMNLTHFFNR
jgi:hypothetical protein